MVCIDVHIWGDVRVRICGGGCGVRCVYVCMYVVGSVCVRVCGVCACGVCVCVHTYSQVHTLSTLSPTLPASPVA